MATIHERQKKKMDGVLFKTDFEKAYGMVKWPFMQQVMRINVLTLNGLALFKSLCKGVCDSIDAEAEVLPHF
jgi:hypothetical protein